MTWKILKSKYLIKNKFLSLRHDRCQKPSGEIVEDYYTIEKPAVAIIAAFTEKNETLLIRQYRHPVQSTDYEIPAGYIEKKDKSILQGAKRELFEETGYKATSWKLLKKAYTAAGTMNNTVHFFIAFNAKQVDKQNLDQHEEIEIHLTPLKKALKLLKDGKIKDLGSLTGFILATDYLKNNARTNSKKP